MQELLHIALLQRGMRVLLAHVTMGLASDILMLERNDQELLRANIPEQSLHGVEARFAKAAAARLASSGFYDELNDNTQIDLQTFEKMRKIIAAELDEWWDEQKVNKHAFCKFFHEPKDADSATPQMKRIFREIDSTYGISRKKRGMFEKVRTAEVEEITGDNIHDMLPAIERVYNQAYLREDAIEFLRENTAASINAFRERTKKGVFVFGFHEKVKGKPSVAEQMVHDFTKPDATDDVKYRGWVLHEPGQENIQAFLTLWEPPYDESHKNPMLAQYLKTGVTGGKMRYTRKPKQAEIEPYIGKTLMIDTICSNQRYAASRLFAKALHRSKKNRKDLQYFMGYRLHELLFTPPFQAFQEPIRFSDNASSADFFESRDCASFAYDHNTRGSQSVRKLSDGTSLYLNPEWVAFNGKFDSVLAASLIAWRTVQATYGDISYDGFDKQVFDELSMEHEEDW